MKRSIDMENDGLEGVYVRVVFRNGEWQVGNGQRNICNGIEWITTMFGTFNDGKWIGDRAVTCEIIDGKTYRLMKKHQKGLQRPHREKVIK